MGFGVEYDEASRKAARMGMCPEKLEDDLILREYDNEEDTFETVM